MGDFICPFCRSEHFVRNGYRQGRQKLFCKDCRKEIFEYYPVRLPTIQKQEVARKWE